MGVKLGRGDFEGLSHGGGLAGRRGGWQDKE